MDHKTSDAEKWIEGVVAQYEGPLLRYAHGITHDLDRARDVVQDVFLRLWQHDSGQGIDCLKSWLFTICRNRALDVLRKETRMMPTDDTQMAIHASPDPSPDQRLETQDTTERLMALAGTLPFAQQEVLRLKFQNDLSYQEISQVTGQTVSNVGYLLHMAIKAIRQKMNSQDHNPILNSRPTL